MKVAKWGNSLAVRLPADVVESLGLAEGDDIQLVAGETGVMKVDKTATAEEMIKNLRKYRGLLPADFKFDRDEANSRD